MNDKSRRPISPPESRPGSREPERRAYRPPELIEWGSITELTLGLMSGSTEGAFMNRGTGPVV